MKKLFFLTFICFLYFSVFCSEANLFSPSFVDAFNIHNDENVHGVRKELSSEEKKIYNNFLYQIRIADNLSDLVNIKKSSKTFTNINITHELQKKADKFLRMIPEKLRDYFSGCLKIAKEQHMSVNFVWQALNCPRGGDKKILISVDGRSQLVVDAGIYHMIDEQFALYRKYFSTIIYDVLPEVENDVMAKRKKIDQFMQNLENAGMTICQLEAIRAGIHELHTVPEVLFERRRIVSLTSESTKKLQNKWYDFGFKKAIASLGDRTLHDLLCYGLSL